MTDIRTEIWRVYVNESHYSDCTFPDEENLSVLLDMVIANVETERLRVCSSYIEPSKLQIKLYTAPCPVPDADRSRWGS